MERRAATPIIQCYYCSKLVKYLCSTCCKHLRTSLWRSPQRKKKKKPSWGFDGNRNLKTLNSRLFLSFWLFLRVGAEFFSNLLSSTFVTNTWIPWLQSHFLSFSYHYYFIVSVTHVLAQTTCSSSLLVQNVNNQSGLIQSGTGSHYSSNMNCGWTITANAKLELAFVEPFQTERNFDFLYVYDGNSSSARLIGRFSGSSRPGTIESSSNQLHVTFTSDGSSHYYGFKAIYRGMCFAQLRPCIN